MTPVEALRQALEMIAEVKKAIKESDNPIAWPRERLDKEYELRHALVRAIEDQCPRCSAK